MQSDKTMFYCPRCKGVFKSEYNRCLKCGKKRLKPPQVNDTMFLCNRNFGPMSLMLEDLLKQNGIPFLKIEPFGSVPIGVVGRFTNVDYFVPFGALEKAQELLDLIPKDDLLLVPPMF